MARWHESEEFVDREFMEYDPYVASAPEYEMHTGDPRQDRELERQYHMSATIQDPVRNFLLYLQKSINERNVTEIQNHYENGFNQLTERYFKNSPWPEAEHIQHLIGEDALFLILYKELYFRHVYARVTNGPTMQQRFESYFNYCNLFNYILSAETPVPLRLPNQWLWDIIDEFIYQFQSFSQDRYKLAKKSEDDIALLKTNPKIWNVHSVLNVLHSMIDKSGINQQLEVYASGGEPETVAGEFGAEPLYKLLGYFSLIGLLRLHTLLGDYHQALAVVHNIDFGKKNMYSLVPSCQISTYYYVAFCYMMMRRYQDAIRTLSDILLFIQRTKQMFQSRVNLYDQINKVSEQLFALLCLCLALHPVRVDESVHSQLREKYSERLLRLQKGEHTEFEATFAFACPKFLSPVPPNYDAVHQNLHKESYKQQLAVFLEEVRQQTALPTIRSYLRLYTTLSIAKLASFMDVTVDDLLQQLMCFKHKMRSPVWTGGSGGLEGELQTCSEVDFYIDGDMIVIADTKVARRFGDFFIRQIVKFDELSKNRFSFGNKPRIQEEQ